MGKDKDVDLQDGLGVETGSKRSYSLQKGRSGLKTIGLLVYKNLLVRKRHYVILILEIILPCLFAFLFAKLKALVPDIHTVDTMINSTFSDFPEKLLAKQLISSRERRRSNYTFVIGYAPLNERTNQIMHTFQESLEKYKGFTKLKLQGFNSEEEILYFNGHSILNRKYNQTLEKLRAAVIFQDGFSAMKPKHLSYTLRLVDAEFQTDKIYYSAKFSGPNPAHAGKGYQTNTGSFAAYQIFLDKAIIRTITGKPLNHSMSVQGFPYPPYTSKVDFSAILSPLFPIFLVVAFIFIVPSILRKVVAEKESGIKELMKMTGLRSYQHWIGWMVDSLLVVIVSITIVVIRLFTRYEEGAAAYLEHGDPTLWWVTLLLYAVAAISFLFCMSTLFQNAIMAVSVGMVFWIISYTAVAIPLLRQYEYLAWSVKMASCLLPNMALHWAVRLMQGMEIQGIGSRWSNIGQPVNTLDDFALQHILIMLIVDFVVYNALTLYLESVLPSKYGLTKPWYFIFRPFVWGIKHENLRDDEYVLTSSKQSFGFENEPTRLKKSVEIKGLRKTFGTSLSHKNAVDGLTFNIYEGQTTVLLGCNGAGKTTLISMLTGLFGPSQGGAYIYGNDIRTDINEIRKSLGYCSQYNILFEKLTVSESLMFFGVLKGLSRAEAKLELDTLLERLHLKEKKHSLAENLSGGQKRKLSLAIAIIGGSKLVIMDEPTAGMDPEARRVVWDLILDMRRNRTMLLTTHFMEEADILGDRVAIMSSGKIHCCGSTLFLKQHYGSGYTLKLNVYTKQHNPEAILDLVKKYVPEARWREKMDDNEPNDVCDIAITLPRQNGFNDTSQFPQLFGELSKSKEELGILHIGLPVTTMDEVFAKVAEETKAVKSAENADSVGLSVEGDDGKESPKVSGCLAFEHLKGLIIKRLLYTSRKRLLFSTQLLLPVFLSIAAILLFNITVAPLRGKPPLKIELGSYKDPKTLYFTTNETSAIGDLYRTTVEQDSYHNSAKAFMAANTSQNINDDLISYAIKDELEYRERFVAAGEFLETHVRAWFQTIPIHASPLAINLVSNALLKSMTPGETDDMTLTVTNHPLKSGLNSLLQSSTINPEAPKSVPIIFILLIPLGLSTLAAGFVVFPLEERLCQAKHLQMMTGVRTFTFWMSSFAWDFFLVLLLTLVITLCFPIFQNYSAFTTSESIFTFMLIIIVYGISAISFSYVLSLVMPSVAGGFALIAVLNMFAGILWSMVVYMTEQSNFFELANKFRWVGRLFPSFGASQSLMRFADKAGYNVKCNIVSEVVKDIVCNPNFTNPDQRIFVEDYQSCCDNCIDFKEAGVTCFKKRPFLEWEGQAESEFISSNVILPGITQELFYLFILAFIYQFLLFAIEFMKSSGKLSLDKLTKSTFPDNAGDVDVDEENKRVLNMISNNETNKDAMVVGSLCKKFGTFAAVSNINFGVHRGECYGLLGVNGAGKTTLFKMLTGSLSPTSGNVHIGSSGSLQSRKKRYMTQIGYCPQYDGLINCLSGREMLELFCRLRGIHSRYVREEADKWLERYGLTSSANVPCGNYSGGMKRRLSAAIAMVGHPKVILLDEPTSGVDPVSRIQFWNLVKSGKDAGQAMILTSHSMEECEVLCSRLSIMVDGQFKCTGTIQHLKSKLSPGFSLVFQLNHLLNPKLVEDRVNNLREAITTMFSPCELQEEHENIIQYRVETTAIDWESIFHTLEKLKSEYNELLEGYSVSELSLEEIFLSTAKSKNSGNRRLPRMLFCGGKPDVY